MGGVATLGIASLRVPILIEQAYSQAKLDAISCASGAANPSVTLNAQPAVGWIAIADIDTSTLDNFQTPVTENRALLAHALLHDAIAKAHVALGGVTWQTVVFSPSNLAGGVIHTVSTGDILQGVASSLMSNMDLRVARHRHRRLGGHPARRRGDQAIVARARRARGSGYRFLASMLARRTCASMASAAASRNSSLSSPSG